MVNVVKKVILNVNLGMEIWILYNSCPMLSFDISFYSPQKGQDNFVN